MLWMDISESSRTYLRESLAVCSGIFGYWAYPSGTKQHYGTAFSTFWGSWAFLIGSYAQLYEMLN